MKFKVGQKLRVIGEEKTAETLGRHEFELGEKVTVLTVFDNENKPHYRVENEYDYWFVHEEDLEEIN